MIHLKCVLTNCYISLHILITEDMNDLRTFKFFAEDKRTHRHFVSTEK